MSLSKISRRWFLSWAASLAGMPSWVWIKTLWILSASWIDASKIYDAIRITHLPFEDLFWMGELAMDDLLREREEKSGLYIDIISQLPEELISCINYKLSSQLWFNGESSWRLKGGNLWLGLLFDIPEGENFLFQVIDDGSKVVIKVEKDHRILSLEKKTVTEALDFMKKPIWQLVSNVEKEYQLELRKNLDEYDRKEREKKEKELKKKHAKYMNSSALNWPIPNINFENTEEIGTDSFPMNYIVERILEK